MGVVANAMNQCLARNPYRQDATIDKQILYIRCIIDTKVQKANCATKYMTQTQREREREDARASNTNSFDRSHKCLPRHVLGINFPAY